NEAGLHHLHGGSQGTAHRIWTIADLASDRVRFEIADPDGHMGYPGTCRIACTYRLTDDGGLSVVHEAETDRVTLCNLTHHSYFNLDGGPDIFDHALMIAADQYLPTDAERIPLGEIAPVAETPFDFRQMRSLGQAIRNGHADYDHNFCVSYRRVEKRQVAELRSDESGISMQVLTSEPGLQFYCGSMLDTPVNGHDGRPYGRYAGLCLESQVWPDAANHEDFPSAVLQPGEGLRQETDYVFSKR
ncbi:MAG: aldose epimerase family protein, partial [Pseudomonadota bacterium]